VGGRRPRSRTPARRLGAATRPISPAARDDFPLRDPASRLAINCLPRLWIARDRRRESNRNPINAFARLYHRGLSPSE
jgi:hypothetical protein